MGTAGAVAVRGRAAPVRQQAPVRPQATVQPVVTPALGNRALGSILGGLTVQRSSCGGACGCGGTCGGEQDEAPAVQRLSVAPTTPTAAFRGAAAPAMRSAVGALQSGAGNAAVARLLAKQQAATPPVQRLGVEDLLPDWISGAIFGAKDKAAAGAAKAQADGQEVEHKAERDADAAASKVGDEAPKLATQAAETKAKADAQMAGGNAAVGKGKADIDAAAAKAMKEMETKATQTKEANQASQLLAGQQPSCSVSKIMNTVEKAGDIVGKPFGMTGAQLMKEAGALINRIGKNVGIGLKAIGDAVKGAKAAYDRADAIVKDKLGIDIATIGKWALMLSNPIFAMAEWTKWMVGSVTKAAFWAGQQLGKLASWAAKEGPALLGSIKSKVGSWFNSLPAPLVAAANAVAAPYLGIAGPLLAAGKVIGDRLKPKADKAQQAAEGAIADAKKKKEEIEAAAKADKAKKEGELGAKKSAEAAKADASGKAAGDAPKKEGDAKAAAIKDGAKDESDKLAHRVCAELDSSAGGCIKDYLPDPGKGKGEGNASALTATVAGEVTVPIPETPISAKIGSGSKVEVARTGEKSYTVSITGDSMLYANVGAGTSKEPETDVKVDMPGGGKGNLAKVWSNLGGSAPAAPAADGGGPQAKGEVDVGYRAQSALVYGFTAGKTNCEGLGGLVALLMALGVKGAGGFLGELAMAAAGGSFEQNLQSRKFTIAQGVMMSGEVKNSFAKAGIKVGGEAGVTYGQEKKDGKMVDTLELFAGASGELTGEFEHDAISGISAGLAAQAQVGVTLGYVKDPATNTEEIDVLKVGGKASGSVSVAAVSLSKLGEIAGPGAVDAVRKAAQIDNTTMDPTAASLKGEVSADVEPTTAKASLSGILNDPAVASKTTVLEKAKEAIKKTKTTGKASIALTTTERLAGANVEFDDRSQPGQTKGAKGSASLDRSETRVLWATTF